MSLTSVKSHTSAQNYYVAPQKLSWQTYNISTLRKGNNKRIFPATTAQISVHSSVISFSLPDQSLVAVCHNPTGTPEANIQAKYV